MRYFITGGAGFIGTNLVRRLAQSGRNEIVIFDNFSNMPFDIYRNFVSGELSGVIERCEVIEGDILDYDHLRRALPTESNVIHLAANTGVQKSLDNPIGDAQTNVIGSLNVLRAAKERGASVVIGASSAAPVGIGSAPPFNEESFPRPISPYGVSKLTMEHYFDVWQQNFNFRCCALRFTNIYGPLSHLKTSVVAEMIKSGLRGDKIKIYGDGHQVRDFLHVDDLVSILIMIAEHKHEKIVPVLQLGTGNPTRIIDVASMVQSALKSMLAIDVECEFLPPKEGDVRENFADPLLFSNTFNFLPRQISVDELFPIVRSLGIDAQFNS